MVLSCVACSNRFSKGEISFHSFPRNNPDVLRHWVAFVPRKNWQPQKFSKLCSDHFTLDCYKPKSKSKKGQPLEVRSNFRLKPDAIPTILLPRGKKKKGRPITNLHTRPYQYAKKHTPDELGCSSQIAYAEDGDAGGFCMVDDCKVLSSPDMIVETENENTLQVLAVKWALRAERDQKVRILPEVTMLIQDKPVSVDPDLEFLPLTVKGETLHVFDEVQPPSTSKSADPTDLCRMCAKFTKDSIKIFGPEGVRLKIVEKMKQHLPIEVPMPGDQLPVKICKVCVQRLEGCHEVAKLAASAEDELKALLNIKHNPIALDSRQSTSKQKSRAVFIDSDESEDHGDISDEDPTFIPVYDEDSDFREDWSPPKKKSLSSVTTSFKTITEFRGKKTFGKAMGCKLCDCEFDLNKALSSHYRVVHEKFLCFSCYDWFDSYADRQRHAHQAHKYPCTFCGFYFLDKDLLKKHIKNKHSDKTPVYLPIKNHVKEKVDCTLCDHRSSSKFYAKQHYFKEHIKYACDLCLELFSESDEQVEHTSQVHEIPCKLCNAKYYSARKLQIHVNKEHKELSFKMIIDNPPLQSPLHIYQCKTCGKGLLSKMYVKRHNYWSHKMYNCDFCLQELDNAQLESEHFEQVHGSKCYFCDEQFDKLDALISHLKCNHDDKNPFSCEHCGQLMADRVELDLHRVEHSNILRNYKCNLCEAAFTTSDKLYTHHKCKHSERNIMCEVCSKTFSFKTQLTSHMITHTKEHPFKCLDCGLSFSLAYKLREHMFIHNPSQQNKGKYNCVFCKVSFLKKRSLNQHIRAIHLDRTIYTCSVCHNCYATENDVVLHLMIHKPTELARCSKSYTKTSALKCAFCSNFFPTKKKLKSHIISHIKKNKKKKPAPTPRLNALSSLEIIAMYKQKSKKKIILSEPSQSNTVDFSAYATPSLPTMQRNLVKNLVDVKRVLVQNVTSRQHQTSPVNLKKTNKH